MTSHLPFSVSAAAIGLVLAGMICVLAAPDEQIAEQMGQHNHEAEPGHQHDGELASAFFHLFHPVHMFFSAAATTAMFWRYERKYLKAVIVGLLGAIVVCGISDIGMPFCSQFILEYAGKLAPTRSLVMHVCVIEHPGLVLPFAAIGVGVGLAAARSVESSTLFSHSLHVFSSTMASIFYLIGPFGRTAWIPSLGIVFLLVVLAVMIPCCISDIVFPLAMAKPARRQMAHCGHHAHH